MKSLFTFVKTIICRFQSNTADAFTRYTVRPANVFVHEYKLFSKNLLMYLLIISMFTACESTDNASLTDTDALPPTDARVSQEAFSTVSPTPSDDGLRDALSESQDIAASNETAPVSAPSELQVHFIDVGQGDATLIICGNDSMLIDAGDNNKGTTVQLYLQKQGIESLTYLIGTHPDSDHIGGLDVIMTKFDCGTIIMPDVSSDTATYRDVIDTMEYRNYKNTLPQVGDTYSLGDAEFTIIAPNNEYSDDNNASVGIRLVHGNNVFLFTGDAEAEAEADILQNGIDLKADVLHAGHHGSDTSGSRDFISAVSPTYAVISCGADNPYGHPHEQTLTVLREQGIQLFRTDVQGSIVAVSDGESIAWNVEPTQNWNAGTRTESDTASMPEPEVTVPETNAVTYVLNRNTGKFHCPDCKSVETIKDSNREDTTLSRDEVIAKGYVPCKICNP